jgi:Rrf2 family protein
MAAMRVSAKADYAVRAMIELATQPAETPVKADQIAVAQDIPLRFVEIILAELGHNDLVDASRGPDGGYSLSRPAGEISIADVVGAVEGSPASVRGERPDQVAYLGSSKPLQGVWLALRANIRIVLEGVSLADVVAGALPEPVRGLSEHPQATAEDHGAYP